MAKPLVFDHLVRSVQAETPPRRGTVRRVRPVAGKKLHSMTHLADDAGLFCGFDDFDALALDGSPEAGHGFYSCDGCDQEAEILDGGGRLTFDHFVDSLPYHETEERMR